MKIAENSAALHAAHAAVILMRKWESTFIREKKKFTFTIIRGFTGQKKKGALNYRVGVGDL